MLSIWPRLSRKHVLIISCIILSIVLCSVIICSTFVTRTTSTEALNKTAGVLMIGGHSSEAQCSLEFYSPSTNNKSRLLPFQLLSCRNHHASVVLPDGRILIVGGATTSDYRDLTTNTQLIDLATQTVTNGPRMLTQRKSPGAAAYKDKVVVCGGFNSIEEIMRSCEMLSENKWVQMKSMQLKRYSPALIVFQDNLFVFGGRTIESVLKSVEKYSFSADVWSSMSPMKSGRVGAGVAELNNDIIVCEGYTFGTPPIKNYCERYVVDEDRWCTFPSMNVKRAEFALCNLDGMLVALGGVDRRDTDSKDRRTIEHFDSASYEWKSYGELAVNRSSTSGVVVSV